MIGGESGGENFPESRRIPAAFSSALLTYPTAMLIFTCRVSETQTRNKKRRNEKMTIEQIIETVKIMLGGRKIVSRVAMVREGGEYGLWAYVLNADGCGKRDTMLASLVDVNAAVTVRRILNGDC